MNNWQMARRLPPITSPQQLSQFGCPDDLEAVEKLPIPPIKFCCFRPKTNKKKKPEKHNTANRKSGK